MKFRSYKTGRIYEVHLYEAYEFYHEHLLNVARTLKKESCDLVGTVFLALFAGDGFLKTVRMGPNLVVNSGRDWVIDRLQSVTGTPALCDYMAIGTGATAPAAGNTTLETEIGTRVQGALSQPSSVTDRLVSTFGAGNGTGALTEAGRLNASSAGTLLCRQTYSTINKGAGDSLQITYDLTV